MIPKVIHYCWFGGSALPDQVKQCISSWKKFCPDYEIRQWNESNFNLDCCQYVKEASEKKKWAFVSDYARFWIIYNFGGVYFDTDVELIKPIDKILLKGPFMSCETQETINPGLGMAAPAGLDVFKDILEYYSTQRFFKSNGSENEETVVTRVTRILSEDSFKGSGKIEQIDGIYIYPPEFFCPLDFKTGQLNITANTKSIHHYDASWHSKLENLIIKLERNKDAKDYRFRKCISLFLRVINKIEKQGICSTVLLAIQKIKLLV